MTRSAPSGTINASLPPLGIGIDTGGTFTDIVLFAFADLPSETGGVAGRILRKAKLPTTHGDYTICIGKAFAALQLTPEETGELRRVCLSTTLATNTVAEGRQHPACLVLENGDIAIPEGFYPQLVRLKSWIDFGLREVYPVSEQEVLDKTAPFAAQVESFAVSGYASTRSPVHEQQIGAILHHAYGKPVVLGSELTHQLNFMQRAQAATLNAGLLPVIMEWLDAVKGTLAGLGIDCPLYIVKGDGSLMEESQALARPVHTLFSGPAASLQGGCFLSEEKEALVIDVGGTTTDIGRIREGRGLLKKGGILINGRYVAVDGLDIATYGLGGDSRLRLEGKEGLYFENRRALPFCRAAGMYPRFSLTELKNQLRGQWHFGDVELLELLALDPHRQDGSPAEAHEAAEDAKERELLNMLAPGPLSRAELNRRGGGVPLAGTLEALLRRRLLLRIAFTPTDLFCAGGEIADFPAEMAVQALACYARMLDTDAAELQARLSASLRCQSTRLLATLLCGLHLLAEDLPKKRIADLLLREPGEKEPTLQLDPGLPLVLVGAAAPLLFAQVPAEMQKRMQAPEHGEVANAVGAITSQYLVRESMTVEPAHRGGVEVFDHQGKRPFPTLTAGLVHAREVLKERLQKIAERQKLHQPHFSWREEVLEDYAGFSRRKHKELVIARVEGMLTGMPS